jgi:electron transfer flavoprotein alpha subunit
MKGARRIVAINKDPDAPILAMADLGVVGDLFQLVPAITEEIRRRRGS